MFDPVRICEILNDERVDYVVVGGFASVIHGSSLPTLDVDLVPSRQAENLDRLAEALTRMNAMIRTSDGPVPTRIDGRFLAGMSMMLNLVTDHGDVDVTFTPSGPLDGFDDWDARAVRVEIADDVEISIGALDDIIESKRAADRPKDRDALPYLESLRDEMRRG
jgi:hypothetical protein